MNDALVKFLKKEFGIDADHIDDNGVVIQGTLSAERLRIIRLVLLTPLSMNAYNPKTGEVQLVEIRTDNSGLIYMDVRATQKLSALNPQREREQIESSWRRPFGLGRKRIPSHLERNGKDRPSP